MIIIIKNVIIAIESDTEHFIAASERPSMNSTKRTSPLENKQPEVD